MSLLEPGSTRAHGVADDAALVAAMVRVELAWYDVLVAQGVASTDQAARVASAVAGWHPDLEGLVDAAEAAGNPVVPFVAALRRAVDDEGAAALIHRGLTSQDVLDSALMLLARDALERTGDDLVAMGGRLAELAAEHRTTVMAGRTLTQHAVPVTFGLVCAQWLTGFQDALDEVKATSSGLPVQCGGAAGTLSLAADVLPDAGAAAQALAGALDLVAPALPWHTRRRPVTRLGDCLVGVVDSVAPVAAQVALLSRPEIGELSEGRVPGRGGSSTMPHKHNPVLSVLVRAAALQAPFLGAQLHLAAAQTVDQRPDGAWHAEWPSLVRLLRLMVTATSQMRQLLDGLQVHPDVMASRARTAVGELLAERDGVGAVASDAHPASYLGLTDDFIDSALDRWRARG
jgi:3-carboxy-cis,cis-muconate cycloisomerase